MINVDERIEEADWPKRTSDKMVDLRAAEFDESKHPRDDRGRWTSGGPLTDDDKKLITEDWAWPDASPRGLDYTTLRNPKTSEGKRMTEVLNKLPVHEGVTYRGVSLNDPKDVEKLVSSKGFELKLHSSASKDFNVALDFADAQSIGGRDRAVLMEMHGRGRNINAELPEELQGTEEIVMMAGTRYRFQALRHEEDRSRNLKYMRVVLKEVR